MHSLEHKLDRSKVVIITKPILTFFVALIGSICVGILGLYLVYQLPEAPIKNSARSSLEILKLEGLYPNLYDIQNGTRDNFTDALMLNTSAFETDGSLQSALSGVRGVPTNDNSRTQIEQLEMALYDSPDIDNLNYERYWNGYLVILKPLLFFGMNLKSIRILEGVFLAILTLLNIHFMFKRRSTILVPAFLASLVCTMSFLSPLSLQFSNVLNITLIANLAILIFAKRLSRPWQLVLVFTLIGTATTFFDLLTYPLLSLGLPLITWLYISRQERSDSLMIMAIVCVISWFAGYACMWASKWVLASIILDTNTIETALSQAQFRTSMSSDIEGEKTYTVLNLIGLLRKHVCSPYFILPVLFVAIPISVDIVRRIKNQSLRFDLLYVVFALVIVLPIIWQLVLSNHTYIHHWMTYKNLGVSVYALLVGLGYVAYGIPCRNQTVRYIPDVILEEQSEANSSIGNSSE